MPPVALIEAFHLTFLRAFTSSVPAEYLSIKGGGNLRLFFWSDRYSEDLDLDVCEVPVHQIRDKVMSILESGGLNATVSTYGYASRVLWDQIRLVTISLIEQGLRDGT